MTIYKYNSYKQIINAIVQDKKKLFGQKVTFEKLAYACRIQKTYLSKVINHNAHLSEDQLFAALEYLGLNIEEQEFALLLMQYEKSQNLNRKALLKAKLTALRDKYMQTEKNISANIPQKDLVEYYLNPLFSLIHIGLCIPKFAKEPSLLANTLGIDSSDFENALSELQNLSVIKKHTDGSASVITDNFHLPKSSKWYPYYRKAMNQLANSYLERKHLYSPYSFNVIFSSDESVRNYIHEEFLQFLARVQKRVGNGPDEGIYQLKFDLLHWA